MSIGERRERITVKRKVRVKRTDGGFDTTLSVVASRWASVAPVRATESEAAGRKQGTVTYLIEVDSRGTDIRMDDVLIWTTRGDIEMNVREVRLPNERALPLTIVAESGAVNSGT